MGVKLLITIRTANRAPKRNYLGQTVTAFAAGGVEPGAIHLFPTDPDIGWLLHEVGDLPVTVHLPDHRCAPNENGIRQVQALNEVDAEWIALCEDDLQTCADPVGSMARWLEDQARPDVAVYRFFALPKTPVMTQIDGADFTPLREMRGSQAIVLRAADARDFAAWATAHPRDWRPTDAPFQDRPDRGFDKLVGYWALQRYPKQPLGMVSRPMLVRHVGIESALYSRGLHNDAAFAGTAYRYSREVLA